MNDVATLVHQTEDDEAVSAEVPELTDFDRIEASVVSDMIRICRDCSKSFQRPSGRGRPPVRCPECRAPKAKSTEAVA